MRESALTLWNWNQLWYKRCAQSAKYCSENEISQRIYQKGVGAFLSDDALFIRLLSCGIIPHRSAFLSEIHCGGASRSNVFISSHGHDWYLIKPPFALALERFFALTQ